jgi:hypothetical protein
MANELTDTGELLALDFLAGLAPTLTGPLKVRLCTVAGTDAAAGTEVTGGSYASQTLTLSASAAGSQTHAASLSFPGMPACSVVGWEIWTSDGTPKRLWYIPRTGGAATVNAGDTFTIPAGGIVLSMN